MIGLLLLAALAATVDDPPPATPKTVIKQEVVVTAAREEQPRDQASAAVTVLTRKDIERLPAESLAEVMAFVPGVTMMFDSGASGIPMVTSRGFFGGGEVEYMKLIIDGVPVGDAESGNVDWRSFRVADIDRIEVLHGPGSSLYGDTALGGVVQVSTRQSPSDDSRGELYANGGSFSTREAEASYIADIGKTRIDLRGGSADTGGFRDHSDTSDGNAQLSLIRFGDQSRWRLDASSYRKDRRDPGPLSLAEIDADRQQSESLFRFDRDQTDRSRVSATYESFGAIPLHATVYGIDRSGQNLRTLLLAPGFGTSALRDLTTRAGGATFEASRDVAGGTLRAGADLERATLSGRYSSVGSSGQTLGVAAAEDGSRNRVGLFVTGGWNICARCRLSAGLRRDDIRDDFSGVTPGGASRLHSASAWSPRAGLNVRLGDLGGASPVSLFAQVSRAFKAPTLDQLFDPRPYPDGRGGTFTISNPALLPQRARNVEGGLSRASATSDWSLVAYRMTVTDEIDFDPQTFSYRNIGSTLHRGIEASAAIATDARISPRFTYAWTRVADTAAPDDQLKNIPENVAQLLLHGRISATTSADVAYRWRHGLSLDDAGMFVTPDVSRVDLRVTHDIGRLRLQADLLNAFDAHYNELGYILVDFKGQPNPFQFPAPGRTFRVGVGVGF
ncbi:MAG TPA: TonB-dependent receptor [Thermoanaerobaculia bacterium]|jgi:outer membrane cobalamin receptor|nr:TonB-dependent receptor [Thermoanaerobaculia bacterium]